MKWIIWTIGGVLAALWTGTLALTAAAVDWTAGALRQAGAGEMPTSALPPELPGWLSAWIEPGTWAAVVQAIQQTMHALQSALPVVGTVTGWLEPLVWALWVLGMIALLTIAAGSHWWLARRDAAETARA